MDFDRILAEARAEADERRRRDLEALQRSADELRGKLAQQLADTFGAEFGDLLEVAIPHWRPESNTTPRATDVEAAFTWRGYRIALSFDPEGHWRTASRSDHGYRARVGDGAWLVWSFPCPAQFPERRPANLRRLVLAVASRIEDMERSAAGFTRRSTEGG